jgi:hypothetical protein
LRDFEIIILEKEEEENETEKKEEKEDEEDKGWESEKFMSKESLIEFIEKEDLSIYNKEDLNKMMRKMEDFEKKELEQKWNIKLLNSLKTCLQINDKFIFILWILLNGPFPKSKRLHSILLQNQELIISFFNKCKYI